MTARQFTSSNNPLPRNTAQHATTGTLNTVTSPPTEEETHGYPQLANGFPHTQIGKVTTYSTQHTCWEGGKRFPYKPTLSLSPHHASLAKKTKSSAFDLDPGVLKLEIWQF